LEQPSLLTEKEDAKPETMHVVEIQPPSSQ
jgi:hypothetical protein